MNEQRLIEVGDRFESKDRRDKGRVVEVIEELGLKESAAAHPARRVYPDAHIRRVAERRTYFHVRTEAHPKNPDAVGHVSRVSERTLRTRYERVSR